MQTPDANGIPKLLGSFRIIRFCCFLMPDCFSNLHSRYRDFLIQKHICQQTTTLRRFQITFTKNTTGGIDFQISKQVNDDVSIVFYVFRRERHLHALHQLLLVYASQNHKGKQLKHTASGQVSPRISDNQESHWARFHRNHQNGFCH